MDFNEATSLLTTLANGVDPITGEALPDASPYNNPKVIRALFAVLSQVQAKGGKAPRKTVEEKQLENLAAGLPRNAGLPWTEGLKKELAEKFKAGVLIPALAKEFERSIRSIVLALANLGLVEQSEADQYRYPRRHQA